MKIKFDVTTDEFNMIQSILSSTLDISCKVWVFGSRAKNSARFNSDLDLALECKNKIDYRKIGSLKDKFDESKLAFSVDIVDLNSVEEYFKKIIDEQKVEFPLKRKVPKLRFKQFSGEWEEKQLNELLFEHKEKNFDNQFNKEDVLSVSQHFGLVNQIKHLGRSYAGKSVSNYPIVRKNDIVYTKSPLATAPYGIIKVNKNIEGIVSTLYAVYRCKEGTSSEFLDYYFSLDDNLNKYLRPLVRKGAKNDMKVNNQKVLTDTIFIPKENEQNEIVSFLTVIDTKIEQLIKEEKLLKKYKKGIIQKIFSREIRFKVNDGSEFPKWEMKKLCQIAKKKNIKNKASLINTVLTNSAELGIVNQQDYFDKNIANHNNLGGYYVVEKNDFIYNPRISLFAPVGPMKRNKLGQGVMSPLYTVLEIEKDYRNFYEYYFETTLWHKYMNQIANFGARHDRMNVTNNDFMKMPLPFPCLEEQEKIANFLSIIDEKIEQNKKALEQTKEFKKGLLQQMFV